MRAAEASGFYSSRVPARRILHLKSRLSLIPRWTCRAKSAENHHASLCSAICMQRILRHTDLEKQRTSWGPKGTYLVTVRLAWVLLLGTASPAICCDCDAATSRQAIRGDHREALASWSDIPPVPRASYCTFLALQLCVSDHDFDEHRLACSLPPKLQ
jgi:hypothetical protein